jgi:small subunit ribosomal protein S8
MHDPISDLVIRIKNASSAGKKSVLIPYSKIKEEICQNLQKNGFIESVVIIDSDNIAKKSLEVVLKYTNKKKPLVIEMKVTSTPGLRRYKSVKDIRPYKNGLGIELFTTSKGVIPDYECLEKKVGGLSILKIM